ncbi:MAG: phosphatase PAP2 family protein [Candidatus Promineifilaceae bacterium]|nr:phosphatase PAP2 family protein [Candidatus Promineifilaceae bacterium]
MAEGHLEENRSFAEQLGAGLRWLGLHEWVVLLAVALIVGGTWGFLELADVVQEGDGAGTSFDRQILLGLREEGDPSDPIGSFLVEEAVRDITALGSSVIIIFLPIVAAIFLEIQGNRRLAIVVLVSFLGGAVLSLGLKEIFARPRPDLVPEITRHLNYSFPSGHSMLSAVVYLTLGTVVAEGLRRPALRIFVMLIAVLITLAVGFSRVYLAVHWPTDVLAGWTVGAIWALLVWVVARRVKLSRRERAEARSPARERERAPR